MAPRASEMFSKRTALSWPSRGKCCEALEGQKLGSDVSATAGSARSRSRPQERATANRAPIWSALGPRGGLPEGSSPEPRALIASGALGGPWEPLGATGALRAPRALGAWRAPEEPPKGGGPEGLRAPPRGGPGARGPGEGPSSPARTPAAANVCMLMCMYIYIYIYI